MKRLLLLVSFVLAVPHVVAAQTGSVNVTATDHTTGARVEIGDATNFGIRVYCVAGCAGTLDTDDGTVAGGQSTGIGISMSHVWDGSNWKRFTIGTAGTPGAQVLTVQGITSMIALKVDGSAVTQPVSLSSVPSHAVTQATGTNLHMVCDSGCSSSTAPADASTFTPSTTPQSPIGGFFQTTATNNALTNLQMGAWQFTANRAGFVNLRNASGTEIGTSSAPVSFASVKSTGATAGSTNLGTLPVIANAAAPSWSEGLQYGISTDLHGSTRMTLMTAAGAAATLASDATKSSTASTTGPQVMALAVSADPTAETTGNATQLITDLSGKLVTSPYAISDLLVSGVTAAMTGTTSTSIVAAPASGLRNYLTQITCTNSHASVPTFVLVQDGSGGTTIYEAYAAIAGGGFAISFPAPLRQPTTATALFVQDVTTGANVICSASGYKGR